MARTSRQRENDKRAKRLEKMREKIESGDLEVRQMTSGERARWDEHSAASERELTAKERARRSAALEKRARIQKARRARPGES